MCQIATTITFILRVRRSIMAQVTMHSLLNHTHPAVLVSRRRCMPFKAANPNRARNIRLTCQAAARSANMPDTSCTQSRRSLLLAGATAAVPTCMLYSRATCYSTSVALMYPAAAFHRLVDPKQSLICIFRGSSFVFATVVRQSTGRHGDKQERNFCQRPICLPEISTAKLPCGGHLAHGPVLASCSTLLHYWLCCIA